MNVLFLSSKMNNNETLWITTTLSKNCQVELVKQVENISTFFSIIQEHYPLQIKKRSKNCIEMKFESLSVRKEFVKNVKIFYPNPLESICHDTQHLMNNEPVYSIYEDNILIGTLNEKQQIQFGKKSLTPLEFSTFHWSLLPETMKKRYTPNNECKLKRKGKFVNFFQN